MRNLSNLAILSRRALGWHQQLQANVPARPMLERILNDGEFVFRVGDPADSVYIIVSGYIVLATPQPTHNGAERVAGEGTIFSAAEAMGGPGMAIMAHARGSATVQIMSSAEVLNAVNPYQNAASPEPRPQRQITDQRGAPSVAPYAPPTTMPETQSFAMTLARQDVRFAAVRPDIVRQIGKDSITIDRFPFLVGRQSSRNSEAMSPPVSLAISDNQPFQLSRRHFLIDQDDEGIIVRDCGSHNGTIVNGHLLGGNNIGFRAVLVPGENEIVAGTLISPFQFSCWI